MKKYNEIEAGETPFGSELNDDQQNRLIQLSRELKEAQKEVLACSEELKERLNRLLQHHSENSFLRSELHVMHEQALSTEQVR